MTAPGWFPDPSDPSRQRFFDGTVWTESYALLGQTPPVPGQPGRQGISTGGKVLLGVGAAVLASLAFGAFGSSHNNALSSASGGGAMPTADYVPTTTKSGFTPGEDNAIAKAKVYLNMGGLSKKGLIHQLEFEKFSTADATFAVQQLESTGEADWNAQAVAKAKQYLNMTGFSRDGLVHQLESGDAFTPSEAQYGASQAYGG
ncbi:MULTISPECIES: Ltp family lipoprotein [unclassified Mycolicibacterium]|uniref:Ltp family lipoprotein n=1 Tax=unclassified Mycolicibacterium TaxID=2636767 RepID=UPI0012DE3E2B|nr:MULTISPECIES: Ltp family lipoprotein [unclassified Mycolicibacterium]MUL81266.1 DUF2510 domain-containing protein [Mycolicibacterium sp. CBMA 329]MUL87032.1 DUF2510 domain-containing protein [Mycolicibacterium sp. CBMA 331]MUL98685.1 DUF2510 domain-containing protein [Mycolicibacterium sp. CBMA 334]MUM25548.1 DUF2510 domain-containing protein [Mycolicibacterium sp. CBMA 295]MUM37329.1 DUF2510 domain-containing protein [Mycolicibacterium sp. CBMA 247]